ncbi:baculoviral IAP repeat-containing protein 7-A-like [Biomphalaria glabrata]|uniref:Baculoviral IAP repeat-containing protein 7-A-like n=1 Tax=Biomphalaria glabrata TaxID=6526 RepID=A0A9W3A231_BIOGL|nr:baculoviral IAP repeat-containing protein 7-A-like [Biomphalaria glabrata]
MQPRIYQSEKQRLKTFWNYPSSSPQFALVLAQAGFIYTGGGGAGDYTVKCVFCQIEKTSWNSEDDVEEVHRTLSPNCPLATGTLSGNVPLTRALQSVNFQEILNRLGAYHERRSCVRNDFRDLTQVEHSSSTIPSVPHTSRSNTVNDNEQNNEVPAPITIISDAVNVNALSNPSSNLSTSASQESTLVAVNSIQSHQTSVFSGLEATSQTPINRADQPVNSPQVSTSNPSTANQSTGAGGPTYSELGIVTDRPKRPEYALKSERLKTFSSWPRGHRLQPSDLADAGFYYAGYGDCARCFYCGGGLRNWEDDDDVWVEHGRWFSKCSFIRQRLGQVFIDAIQDLNKTLDKIPYSAVVNKIGSASYSSFLTDVREDALKKDPAVRSVVELGIPQSIALEMARLIKSNDGTLSSDSLLSKIRDERPDLVLTSRLMTSLREPNSSVEDLENIRRLKETNNVLRQQTACKICMDKEVEIVFLPCGHLVSCTECAAAMKDCPVCRKHVKGTVRAFVG